MLFIRSAVKLSATIHSTTWNYSRKISTSGLARFVKQPVQSYISTSDDPYLNLSIENHLLQNSPPDSAILFFYVNRPSIVIGRNQNPWLEVNLPLLRDNKSTIGNVDLVRRRSGGGTVFHDEGNVNWSVIVHPSRFTRDKHCEMVVRALHNCGILQAKVNERHDVVVDRVQESSRKVSGSAYKLTKHRALHHGTCLLSSPNLAQIGRYLRSPAKPYITAKGVESVSSPIANVGLNNDDFIEAVRKQFDELYRPGETASIYTFEEDCADVSTIAHDMMEMRSLPWMYSQTPQFTIRSPQTMPGGDTPLMELSVRHGTIEAIKLGMDDATGSPAMLHDNLVGKTIYEIVSWRAGIQPEQWGENAAEAQDLANWLQEMFPAHDSPSR